MNAVNLYTINEKRKEFVQSEFYKITSNWLQFSLIGIISYISLYFRAEHISGVGMVIIFGGVSYTLVYAVEMMRIREIEQKRKNIIFVKLIFRLVYTAIYLTVIIIDIIKLAGDSNKWALMINGLLFIWVLIWGTRDFWINRIKGILEGS